MKIVKIGITGVQPAEAQRICSKSGAEYYTLTHGEEGRGRWQIRIPLAAREFPSPAEGGHTLKLDGDYKLVDLHKLDPRGNPLYLIALGKEDGQQLVLLSLSPGFRGSASYEMHGQAEVIAYGEEAQGDAGRMGGAKCPVILVTGPCRLTWHRWGRLYGGDVDWAAEYDGKEWRVTPTHTCAVEDAAFNY